MKAAATPEPAATDAPAVPSVRVVIVNYRTPQLTIDCLKSLDVERGGRFDLTVDLVDGGSGDDSPERLRHAIDELGYGEWVNLIISETNRGFAGGNNVALQPALASDAPPDYLWLLNPDTVVRPGAVSALVDYLDHHPDAGIVGSRLEHPDGSPQVSAFRFPTAWSEFENSTRFRPITAALRRWVVAMPVSDTPHRADWLSGASLMIRREVFASLGEALDEAYFMYYEELDFCLAAHRAGFQCWYVPDSRVVHLIGQASGVADSSSRKPQKRRPAYWFASRKRYFVKNHGRLYATLADALWLVGFASWRVRRVLQRKPDHDPPKMLGDFLRHSVFAKGYRTEGRG